MVATPTPNFLKLGIKNLEVGTGFSAWRHHLRWFLQAEDIVLV